MTEEEPTKLRRYRAKRTKAEIARLMKERDDYLANWRANTKRRKTPKAVAERPIKSHHFKD